MAKFKCLQSGSIVSFENDWDIRTMQQHPDYMEIKEEVAVETTVVAKKATKATTAE